MSKVIGNKRIKEIQSEASITDSGIADSDETLNTFLDSNDSILLAKKQGVNGASTEDAMSDKSMESSSDISINGRQKWTKSHEFVFALAGCAIGLGNVWRFPYLCYKYGGGSFMVAYLFFLLIVGVPMLMLEVTIGQFMSRGGIEAWNMVPLFKGIGFASLVIVIYMNIYYIVILAWILNYFVQTIITLFTSGFNGTVPWSSCFDSNNVKNFWASECCSSNYAKDSDNNTVLEVPENCTAEAILPEAEYFSYKVLKVSSGIDDFQGMNWELFGYLVLAWVIVGLCVYRGAKSTGKAAYITATFPLVVLVALVVRGVTLPGAVEGLKYYVIPDPKKLVEPETWMAAASQILFSFSLCQGALTSLGSYNKWSFNAIRWTAKLAFLNSFASMFAGLAIFSILGHLSHSMGVTIDEVADKGPGLAFIAYPRALSSLEFGPAFWNMMFFLMLFMLGIATQCAAVEGMITTIVDLMPNFFIPSKPIRRQIFVGLGCFTCFILALPMVTKSGVYFFQLMDSYGASGISLMLITILQVTVISWIYGIDKFFNDLKEMCYESRRIRGVHKKTDPFKAPWLGLKYIWKYATPLSLTIALIYNFTDIKSPTYESRVTGIYEYPAIGCAIAVFLVLSSLMTIPIFAIIFVIKRKRNGEKIDFKSLTESSLPADHPYMNGKSHDLSKPIIHIRDSPVSIDSGFAMNDSREGFIVTKTISNA
jgi:SNF family Na+-dependent transporter